uniref:Uncharacterized protein n=1 Tax=Chromera velia CCMP2878 TaxID=1169474 RepID=A0A0G4HV87_9ALVE|eukprot:Cvel_8811.t1-p1 / transcript=Cvel_8811.t1 / gene=Cvel_8811 / organism=Chromera_velia_CCMP2878 / gene_product=hypothetical protein / transcript_product=hypothetical protein / location=Cvel_scaffold493:69476-70348(+) / protein_length=291 / sequence_SO=supercontig / SO=protein_coding / is_pseudo=false
MGCGASAPSSGTPAMAPGGQDFNATAVSDLPKMAAGATAQMQMPSVAPTSGGGGAGGDALLKDFFGGEVKSSWVFDSSELVSFLAHFWDDRPELTDDECPRGNFSSIEDMRAQIRAFVDGLMERAEKPIEAGDLTSAVHLLICNGCYTAARHLVEQHGVDIGPKEGCDEDTGIDNALHAAVKNMWEGGLSIQWLHEELGIPFTAKGFSEMGVLAYAISCCSGSDKFLLRKYPEIAAIRIGAEGDSALHELARMGELGNLTDEVKELLKKKGLTEETLNGEGKKPADVAFGS